MGQDSGIEWTDHTMNFWVGCQKVSPACDHCYAEAWAHRSGHPELWAGLRRRTRPANWAKLVVWNQASKWAVRRDRVFTNSLADFFDDAAIAEWRDDAWEMIRGTPFLDWLILTKRPENIARMLPPDWGAGWSHVALGATVENQEMADRRISHLLAVPARMRFLSMEPLLESVAPDLAGIHWVIAGGESGPGARPSHPDWFRSIRDQCQAAGVPFLFKQWGDWFPAIDRERDDPDWRKDYSIKYDNRGKYKWLNLAGGCGFHGDRFHVMERIGKANAGRQLDGIDHDAFPNWS